jgi:hypothetical protein
VLGDKLKAQADKVTKMSGEVTDNSDPGQTTQLQGASQQLGIMMNSFSDVIKTLGQGMSTMASKN